MRAKRERELKANSNVPDGSQVKCGAASTVLSVHVGPASQQHGRALVVAVIAGEEERGAAFAI